MMRFRTTHSIGITRISTTTTQTIRGLASKVFSSGTTTPWNKSSSSSSSSNNNFLDGATVAIGGFGPCGVPQTLIDMLVETESAQNLTLVALDVGTDNRGVGKLIRAGKVRRMIAAYVGENNVFRDLYFSGQIEVELTPMGTIVQRLRAGGMGIPAFYVRSGASTLYGDGGLPLRFTKDGEIDQTTVARPQRTFNGVKYLLEHALRPDLSLVKANVADTKGNLVFRGTARNSNPDCAVASGGQTWVEAEQIVPTGNLDPDQVHLPGIYVHGVIPATTNDRAIERLRLRTGDADEDSVRERIARRAALEFRDGMYVNLGIGLPTLTANYIPDGIQINLQAENGLLGVGAYPESPSQASADWINAGKETITTEPGASTFCSSDSFGMIRGSHVDLTILGGLQCSAEGDLASWIVPGKMIKGMGGAMDLVSSNSRVVVTMQHTTKDGSPRILEHCSYPLTGFRVVDRIITEMGVFDCDKKGTKNLRLVQIAPGVSVEDIIRSTGCAIDVDDDLA